MEKTTGFAGAEDALTDVLDDILGPGDQVEGDEPEGDDDEPLADESDEGFEGEEEPSEEAEEEAESPAIDAPHSWSKEDKEVFSSLPPEAQAVVARREKERDQFVNAKAREAADTRRVVETEARDVIGKMYENHATQLAALALWPVGSFDLFARLGANYWEADAKIADGSVTIVRASDDDVDVVYGAGAQYRYQRLALRLEYERIALDESDADTVSLGVTYSF